MKDFDYYDGIDIPFPDRPKKPLKARPNATAAEVMAYAKAYQEWENAMPAFRELEIKWRNDMNERETEFRNDLFAEYDVTDNPKRIRCYEIAYERGHSAGSSEIRNEFAELVELIK